MMNLVNTLIRPVQTKRVSLNTASGVWRFSVSSGKAATISAQLIDGAWGAGTLAVKYWAGKAGPFAFASGAKTIAAGGGAVVASTTDMAGVTEIEVAWLATAVTGIIDLVVATDQDVTPTQDVSGTGFGLRRRDGLNFGEPMVGDGGTGDGGTGI